MHLGGKDQGKVNSDSYIEVRLVATVTLTAFLLAAILPFVFATDWEGDNLPDSWKQEYGLGTNVYDATNLVGWWQLNGTNNTDNAVDRSSNGISGTLSGFPTNAYGTGLFSNALYFTTNASVTFPTTNSVLNNITNQFTFSAWFQGTNTTSNPATIATWSDASTNGWDLGVTTNGAAHVTFYDGSTLQSILGTTNVNLNDGNWHQVVATYTTNQVATVYVDGTGDATNTITGWTPGSVASFTFGAPNAATTNNPYALDEVRLYNRALGSSEIAQLPPTYSDLNGSGLSVIDDFLEGLDPLSTTGIITSGFIDSGLTGYYSSGVPTLTKSSGDAQSVAASTFASNPLVVHVTNGSTALVGAPITFTIASGSDGGLSLTSGGTATTSLSLVTDSSGNATVYYESGPDALKNNTITATAVAATGNTSVGFTAYCGVQSGLSLWLKADAGVTSSSGAVSEWDDQSPAGGYNMTQSTSGHQPGYIANDVNGKPALRFNGSQWLSNSSNLGLNADMTMIVVGMTTSPATQQYSTSLGDGSTGNTSRGIGYYQSKEVIVTDGSYTQGTMPDPDTFMAEAYTLDSTLTNVAFYRNGVETATGTISGAANLTAGITVGGFSTSYFDWQGDIAEVLVYDHKLSSTELEQVDGYLADKYGYYSPNATWPLAYSSDVQTQITANQWTQAQSDVYVAFLATDPPVPASGLTLWLKADSGVTSSSGNVSEWADQSGNGINATQTISGAQPVLVTSNLNGKPVIRFNGSNYLTTGIPIANSSFETPSVGGGGYEYGPTGGSWTFASSAGLQSNGSPWAAANAPGGSQTAFLQGGSSSISQSVSFSAGTYTMNFYAAQRLGQTQPIQVSVDSTVVGTYTPGSDSFGLITTAPFTVSAGSHTVTLAGTNSSGDNSSFVDGISIQSIAALPVTGQTFTAFMVATPETNGVEGFYNGINASSGALGNGWGFERNSGNYDLLFAGQEFIGFGTYDSSTAHQILCAIRTSDPVTTFYENGVQSGSTSTAAMNAATGAALIGGDSTADGYYFTGDIAEILVYNRALTDTEREAAEGYLADKYGLYDPYATWPSSYSSDIQAFITEYQWTKAQADAYVALETSNPGMDFDGLKMWLKADTGVTYNSSNQVDIWADQSPSGSYSVTQITSGNQPTYITNDVNGKPALRFNGSQWLGSLSTLPGVNADMTIIVVGSYTGGTHNLALWLGAGASNPEGNRSLGYAGSGIQYFDTYGVGVAGAPVPPFNTFVEEGVTINSALTNVTLYRNGVETASGSISGVQNLSAGITVGAYPGDGYAPWQGDIAEVLVYDHQLSSDELAEVDGYLADKYGYYSANATWPLAYSSDVQAEIERDQWTKVQADNYVALQSANPDMLTNGLVLWLKADDTGAVNQDGSGNVNSWSDEAGNYSVSQSGTARPTYVASDVNGKPALRFNGSQWLTNSSSLISGLNEDMTMITVSMSSAVTHEFTLWLGNGSTSSGNRAIGYAGGNEILDTYGNGVGGIAQPSLGTFVTEIGSINSSLSSITLDRNGTQTATGSISGVQNLTSGITVGGISNSGNYAAWQGDIAEVLVYDHQLSTDELAEVDGYLADKYGLYDPNATWPSAYSTDVQAEITLNQWDKTQADNYVALQSANPDMLTDGLLLWLKADAGVTQSSGSVSAWADQTGNYPVTQSTSGNQPSYISSDINGEPALRFNGSQWLANSSALLSGANADMTMITVSKTTSLSSLEYSCILGGSGVGGYRGMASNGSTQYFDTSYIGCNGASTLFDTFSAETDTLNSARTGVAFYRNGTEVATGTLSGVEDITAGLSVGALAGGSYTWQGDIAEVLVYDHKLTSTELQEVGVYLANKYGLAFAGTAPTISPSGGSYGSTHTVTITSNQSVGTLHYTLDGTTPTAWSPTYTTSISLSSSALVQAAVFSSVNVQLSQIASAQFYVNDTGSTGFPPVATGLTATAVSPTEVDLGWSLAGLRTYSQVYVYRSTNSGVYELIAVLKPSATSFADTTVTAGNSYAYEVGTVNQAGISSTSPTSAVSPSAALTLTITVTTPSGATALP